MIVRFEPYNLDTHVIGRMWVRMGYMNINWDPIRYAPKI
jgi:hypothetical protein